jgi:hypothetical protein
VLREVRTGSRRQGCLRGVVSSSEAVQQPWEQSCASKVEASRGIKQCKCRKRVPVVRQAVTMNCPNFRSVRSRGLEL